jgi:hypothetical protein
MKIEKIRFFISLDEFSFQKYYEVTRLIDKIL